MKGKIYKQPVVIMKCDFQITSEILLKLAELARFDHPNVIKVMGFCTNPNNFCIIYEYMKKGSLQDYIEQK